MKAPEGSFKAFLAPDPKPVPERLIIIARAIFRSGLNTLSLRARQRWGKGVFRTRAVPHHYHGGVAGSSHGQGQPVFRLQGWVSYSVSEFTGTPGASALPPIADRHCPAAARRRDASTELGFVARLSRSRPQRPKEWLRPLIRPSISNCV